MIPVMNDFYQINKGFPWTVRVHVQTSSSQFECYSPTHKLVKIEDAFSNGGYTFEFDRSEYHRVSESFVFRFRTANA